MTGVLILAQRDIGNGLLNAVEHVMGERPPHVEAFPVSYDQAPERLIESLRTFVRRLDDGSGVLILADIYGATHINAACRLIEKTRIELVAGVNLPMLIRVLNYRDLELPQLVDKAVNGGREGICTGEKLCLPGEKR